jgi:hypothetical protein
MYKSEHVIPAQAGIHSRQGMRTCDPRLRGDDSGFFASFQPASILRPLRLCGDMDFS